MNILIIDDDPIARMLAKRNLEILGFKGSIITAENGKMGYEILTSRSEKFIIILDYHMPELDGIGFLRKLGENQLEPPTFMLSSSILEVHQNECLDYPFVQEYLVKPIDKSKTEKIIEFARRFIAID
ncbi:response regulator [bacterium SCSIO 12643]|nr:response regulator [bacterium SCSIO 12643]